MPFCPYCGGEMKEDHLFCRNCGRRTDERVSDKIGVVRDQSSSQPNVWIPSLWLVAILFGGLIFDWLGGAIVLILATIWVYRDSKKHGISGSEPWLLTRLLAVVGLPLYAYR